MTVEGLALLGGVSERRSVLVEAVRCKPKSQCQGGFPKRTILSLVAALRLPCFLHEDEFLVLFSEDSDAKASTAQLPRTSRIAPVHTRKTTHSL